MRKHIWAIAFSACLVGFTAFISLDTFAFASAYQENATEMNTSMFEGVASSSSSSKSSSSASGDAAASSQDSSASSNGSSKSRGKGSRPGKSSEGSSSNSSATTSVTTSSGAATGEYSDDNATISVSSYTVANTTVHVADVQLSSTEYLKTAFANDTYGKNVTATTSATAAAHNAVLAINGDNYGSRETGYVIRNGIVYRDTSDGADVGCVYADGTFGIVDSSTVSAQELVEQGVWQAFSFGPALVKDGAVSVSASDEVGRAMASNPRTAIGIIDDNHYVFVVSDGRTSESEGLSLSELAQFMQQQLGVKCAYNLDGGGSSTMVFQDQIVNTPTTNGNSIEERKVNDIVYIG